jgi:thioredoxin-related protein
MTGRVLFLQIMRKIFLVAFLFGFIATLATAQTVPPPAQPPYLKDRAMPDFKIMRMDSSFFNTKDIPKGKNSLFIIFSPDCHHCQEFIKALLAGIDSLKSKNIELYLVSPIRNPGPLRNFYSEFHIENYPDVKVVGQDTEFFVMDFFGVRMFPTAVMYDRQKKLVQEFGRETTLKDICNQAN